VGLDYDEKGQFFAAACVIPHMWHVVQNGRYQRQSGQHNNPYTFDDIKQIGDHVHYQGKTPHAGNNRSDAAGGGHAHSGLMVYNGDNWPAEYRGKLFMNNIHGARLNMDVPEAAGSGYVGRHGKDFLFANDKGSQILNMKVGPDGAVYMIDWYDLQQCHTQNPKDHDRTTGRIFKVSYGDVKQSKVDLEKLSDAELVKLQTHKNEWYPRTARRVLQERAAAKDLDPQTHARCSSWAGEGRVVALRVMWALHVTGGEVPLPLDKYPHLLGWMIQLKCEDQTVSLQPQLARGVGDGQGQQVPRRTPAPRLMVPQAPRRTALGHPRRPAVSRRGRRDHNLPLMYWYGLESVMDADTDRALALAAETKIPNILAFAARRQALIGGEKELDGLVDPARPNVRRRRRVDILRGMVGRPEGPPRRAGPGGWDALEGVLARAENADVAEQARALSVVFGSKAAMAGMTKTALDRSAAPADRLAAIDSLREAKDPALAGTLQQLLDDPAVRSAAIRGLAGYDDANTPAALLGKYATFTAAEKKDALLTLAARPAYAKVLAGRNRQGRTEGRLHGRGAPPAAEPEQRRRERPTDKHWAAVRESEKDVVAKIKRWKRDLDQPTGAESATRGRLLYNKTCAGCHTLYGDGGKVGPDITGADRGSLDYLLLHIVDPNAVIPADYVAWQLDTKDDRTIIGILKKDDPQAVTLATANETVTVARGDVATLKPSKYSMMPEGLLDTLPEPDVRDLIAYLRSPNQVPALADADAAKQLFNGKDLTGWEAIVDDVFSVEDGEIVGRTKTG
jgi:putative heme-binding domain-containing protein